MHARRVVLRVLITASVIAAATVYLPAKEPVRSIDLHQGNNLRQLERLWPDGFVIYQSQGNHFGGITLFACGPGASSYCVTHAPTARPMANAGETVIADNVAQKPSNGVYNLSISDSVFTNTNPVGGLDGHIRVSGASTGLKALTRPESIREQRRTRRGGDQCKCRDSPIRVDSRATTGAAARQSGRPRRRQTSRRPGTSHSTRRRI